MVGSSSQRWNQRSRSLDDCSLVMSRFTSKDSKKLLHLSFLDIEPSEMANNKGWLRGGRKLELVLVENRWAIISILLRR